MIAEQIHDLLAFAHTHHARINVDTRQLITDGFVKQNRGHG